MPVRTFLVEDNDYDVRIIKRALALVDGLSYKLEVFSDGEEVLERLHEQLPDFMIIDINLPKIDGKQILKILKNDERTRHIPILILTTSSGEDDIKFAYAHGANAYLTKPFDLIEFVCAVQSMGQFWMRFVRYT